jgi:hypothetical protein
MAYENAAIGLQNRLSWAHIAAQKAESRTVSQAMDIVAARSIGLKPSSVSIACGNYHRGGFCRGKTL